MLKILTQILKMSEAIKITRKLETDKPVEKAKYMFKFEDGTEVPFNDLKIERHNYVNCGQPPKIPGQNAGSVNIYVTKEIYDFERKQRYERNVNPLPYGVGTQVGVLVSKSAIGIPAGAYVPMRWNNAMRRFDLYTSGLTNETLILEKSIASADVIAEVEKAKKAEEVEVED